MELLDLLLETGLHTCAKDRSCVISSSEPSRPQPPHQQLDSSFTRLPMEDFTMLRSWVSMGLDALDSGRRVAHLMLPATTINSSAVTSQTAHLGSRLKMPRRTTSLVGSSEETRT